MIQNFEYSLKQVLKSEGGYTGPSGLKGDSGGETNMGVTKAAWSTWLKRPIADGEMAKLTVEDVTPFYKALYWDKSSCNQLPTGVDYALFDASVNMGVGQAIRLLQRAIGCVPDAVIGNKTIEQIHNNNNEELIDKFSDQKITFYKNLSNFPTFGKGWLSRVETVRKAAKEMIS
jgi:lysozyme family protein